MILAFRSIRKDVATLEFFGTVDARYKAHLESIADRANPPIFRGRYERMQLPDLLADIDVAVVPSNCEDTLPSTITECHALGIPVLGSRIGGIPEQIRHEENGLLFDPGDPPSLKRALQRVIDDRSLIDQWRRHLPSAFDPVDCWEAFESACYELAGRRSVEPEVN